MPRTKLKAKEATNDGVRRLREKLRWRSAAVLAEMLTCDVTAVRRWARGVRTPSTKWCKRLHDVLAIPIDAWEDPPEYDGETTTRAHG